MKLKKKVTKNKFYSRFHTIVVIGLLVSFLPLSNLVIYPSSTSALAETSGSATYRLAGATRYDTAIEISQAGWANANTVVLARGDAFPDALAGAVLAHSPQVNGPLLLTQPNTLTPAVLEELRRLNTQTVYLLGGTGALSQKVEDDLVAAGLTVERVSGNNRYETSSNIAKKAAPSATQAFLVNGSSYADSLSISSYAANQGIPLLLTEAGKVPDSTLEALQALGVSQVTLIGGEGVIKPSVQTQLEGLGLTVNRVSGANRYLTNTAILNAYPFDTSTVYVATGESFPDALAGGVLAAQQNQPIVLVPSSNLDPATSTYLSERRTAGTSFTILGGWGAISYGIETMVRTGSTASRISLQYLHGNSFSGLLDQLNLIPGTATDYVDVVAPSWYTLYDPPTGQTAADGSFYGVWDATSNNYQQFVSAAHGRDLKVTPVLHSSWANTSTIDSILKNPVARQTMIEQIVASLNTTGADGIVIDFEFMNDDNGPYLTQFMNELYAELHPQNKLVIMAVMSRTSPTAEPWLAELNYHDLAQAVDYLNIMTYDYSTATPGPISPLPWVEKVLSYTASQDVDMKKVLMGVPYYGRDWIPKGTGYTNSGIGYARAAETALTYGATIKRDTTTASSPSFPVDPVGIPNYTYLDNTGVLHTIYYEDPASWQAKLTLLDKYHLGGIGAWSLYWVTQDTANVLYPLLNQHLR